jgi:hypothetical protein
LGDSIGKAGPKYVFLITIRDYFQNLLHLCFRHAYPALPEFDYSPALLEQLVSVPEVMLHILVEFGLPAWGGGFARSNHERRCMPGDELTLTRVCLEDFIGAIDT